MADTHKNFAYSLVATAPSPATSGTSLVVTAGQGSRFAANTYATVWPAGAHPLTTNAEIVRITAVSTDTLTITRTQEGTAARTIVVGDQIAQTITAATIEQYLALSGGTITGAVTINGGNDLTLDGGRVVISDGSEPAAFLVKGTSDGSQYANFTLSDPDGYSTGHEWNFSHRVTGHRFLMFNYNGADFRNVELLAEDGTVWWGGNIDETNPDTTSNAMLTSTGLSVGGVTPAAKSHVLQPTLGNEVQRLTSTATNDDPIESVFQNRVTTTDATVTTIHTVAIPASTTVLLDVTVVARRTGGTAGTAEDGASYKRYVTYKNVAGTATLIGSATATHTNESQAGWDVTFVVSSGNVNISVTGAANNNVTWHATVRVYKVSS